MANTQARTNHPFLERVRDRSRGPVLFDGASGTWLHTHGNEPMDGCFVALNRSRPDLVSAMHRGYLAVGAEAIKTNTFMGNRFQLDVHGYGDDVRDLNKRAARLARDAREISGASAWVAGSVGPTGRLLAPIGTSTTAEIRAAFREQIEALIEGSGRWSGAGVDVLLLETFSSLAEIREAIIAAREVTDAPIIASMTFAEDDRTPVGHAPRDVARELTRLGVDVIGVNCSVGPQNVTRVALAMRDETDVPISAMPNAGWPANLNGRIVYASSPAYLALHARQAAAGGVRILGGCCGTEPEHIGAMRAALDALIALDPEAIKRADGASVRITPSPAEPEEAQNTTEMGSEFGRKLARGEFVTTVEVAPPRGLNPAKVLAGAQLLKDAGVDAVDVTDSARARLAMSPIATCALIQQRVGIEAIVHLTTRDRSLMGLQADLLGAHASGLRNILALTGDPPSLGNYPNSTAVYDVDSVGLIGILKRMNVGEDIGGNAIGAPAGFTIACGVDPTRDDLHEEARRLRRKIEAGAHFAMIQPVFAVDRWLQFLDIYGPIPVPVLFGIMPIQNARHAEFLHNEVPGIVIPDDIRARMAAAGHDGRHIGIALAQQLLLDARAYVQGVYIMPQFGRYEQAGEILSVLGDQQRDEVVAD